MKFGRGFLTMKDDETKKEVPFFVRVRNEDISMTKSVIISESIQQTSNQWILAETYKDLDATIYRYTHKIIGPSGTESYTNPSNDGHGEKVYNIQSDCEVYYKVYFDGRYEVYGHVSLLWNVSVQYYFLQLPFALPNLTYQSISSMGLLGIGWHMSVEVTSQALSYTNYSTSSAKYPYFLQFKWNSHSGYSALSESKSTEPVGIRFEGRWK